MEELNDWNCCMAENARKLFPNALILNSFGSLDCSQVAKLYESFRFDFSIGFNFTLIWTKVLVIKKCAKIR